MRAKRIIGKVVPMVLILLGIATLPALANPLFEALPTNLNAALESRHGTFGPILADDFVPVSSGTLSKIEWWGSSAPSNSWELAFHTNNPSTNVPNIDNPVTGAKVKEIVTATGVADVPGHLDIYHFTALVNDPLLAFSGGTEYWLTVANFDFGWTWAEATLGPTVGSESFNVVRSIGVGLDGGPHSGPWISLNPTTEVLAFRLQPVPEPATMLLLGSGLIGLAGYARKRFKK